MIGGGEITGGASSGTDAEQAGTKEYHYSHYNDWLIGAVG